MKKLVFILAASLATTAVFAGYSGSRGGFSSGGSRSYSSPSYSRPAPSYSAPSYSRPSPAPSYSAPPTPRPSVAPPPAAPVNNRGGFNSQAPRSPAPAAPPVANRGGFNSSNVPPPRGPAGGTNTAQAPRPQPRTTTTTTTTTTVNRVSNQNYGGNFVSPMGMYGGWGMGYGYTNGLLTGLIIGNMMHPHGTVMYSGPGYYANNALLYPNGQVVDQSGRVVGMYANGQFTPVSNGQVVAQPVPADAYSQPQPVTVVKAGPSAAEVAGTVILWVFSAALAVAIILMLV